MQGDKTNLHMVSFDHMSILLNTLELTQFPIFAFTLHNQMQARQEPTDPQQALARSSVQSWMQLKINSTIWQTLGWWVNTSNAPAILMSGREGWGTLTHSYATTNNPYRSTWRVITSRVCVVAVPMTLKSQWRKLGREAENWSQRRSQRWSPNCCLMQLS